MLAMTSSRSLSVFKRSDENQTTSKMDGFHGRPRLVKPYRAYQSGRNKSCRVPEARVKTIKGKLLKIRLEKRRCGARMDQILPPELRPQKATRTERF